MAGRECSYDGQSYKISYEIVNPAAARTILLLHGWGSNREIMKQAFGGTLGTFRHIYVDMPGFGKSPNERFLTTDDYAGII